MADRATDLRIDVGEDEDVAVTVFLPRDVESSVARPVAFTFPGGGYSRGYYDIDAPGYSQASYHTDRGWIVVSCDHLGVGDSALPEPSTLTYERLAKANDVMVRTVVSRLRAGRLIDGLGPIDVSATIGIGQSMGGCLSIVAQGRHETFDALAVLGFSAVHTVLPTPDGPAEASLADRGDLSVDLAAGADVIGGLDVFRWGFHWEDVEPDLLAADLGESFPFRTGDVPTWASRTVPPAALSMLTAGVVSEEAARIDVPVFLGTGERDVVPDPRAEPAAYRSCSDVTVVVVPTMAHMHNFASTRADLWDRLHAWGENIRPRPLGGS